MAEGPPKLIAINHDDYHASHVGRMSDGRQFFLATPFEPEMRASQGREFVALFLFDPGGSLIEAKIDDLGPRAEVNEQDRQGILERRVTELGDFTFGRIEVAPFVVRRFGSEFGLIAREPEEDGEPWVVEMQPGNYMAFFEPWDSGEYDT